MKRIVSIIAVLLLSAITFVSCTEPEPPVAPDIYQVLDGMSQSGFSNFELSVTTEGSGHKLTNTYKVSPDQNGRKVEFCEEKLNPFTEENGEFVTPVSYKTVTTGTAYVNGNTVTGDSAMADVVACSTVSLAFTESNFEDVISVNNSFKATVKNLAAFFCASDFDVRGANLTVTYTSDKITSLCVVYTDTDGVKTTLTYTFK